MSGADRPWPPVDFRAEVLARIDQRISGVVTFDLNKPERRQSAIDMLDALRLLREIAEKHDGYSDSGICYVCQRETALSDARQPRPSLRPERAMRTTPGALTAVADLLRPVPAHLAAEQPVSPAFRALILRLAKRHEEKGAATVRPAAPLVNSAVAAPEVVRS